MGTAPSEKHLEDWIVKNPYPIIGDVTNAKAVRQYQLPSGITDLIFWGDADTLSSAVLLVELKKRAINAAAFAQACRYLRDLRAIGKIALDIMRNPYDGGMIRYDPKITGVLIGHSIEDKNLLIAADMADITLVTYQYNAETNDYVFEEHHAEVLPLRVRYEYACDVIGIAIQEAWAKRVEELAKCQESDTPPIQDFIDGIDIFLLEKDYGVVPFWRWMENHEEGES